jgi:hypothetical protein
MKRYEDVDKEGLHDLLSKGWLTHDGTWFFSAANEFGLETANRLNKAAIRALAPLEMQRCRKLLLEEGEELAGVPETVRFMLESLITIMPTSVSSRFRLTYPAPNAFRWEWEKGECFAYKGLRQLGFLEDYQCGVIYRIECWLDALGIPYEVLPPTGPCIMHTRGECSGEFRFPSSIEEG